MSATLGSNLAKQFERVLSATGSRRVAPCILIIVSLFSLPEISGFGQNLGDSGAIQGSVLDPSGAVIKGATVKIINPVSGYDRAGGFE